MTKKVIKILAIDDQADNLVVLKTLIKDSFPDAVFIMADSGRKGFELCEAEIPDVILLDIVMPGMDGYEVCKKLKDDFRLKNIPVIMVTAHRIDKNCRVKALEAGADVFLQTPVDLSELKAQIKAMLRIKEAEDLKKAEKQHLEDLVLDRTEALENELNDRIKAENKLIQSFDKITRNRQAIMNLMEDLKVEIEERKLVENNLKEERNLLRTLIDNLLDPIYILDNEGCKIVANKADLKNIGIAKEEEVLGKNDLDLFPGEIGIRGHNDNMSVIIEAVSIVDREEYFTDSEGNIKWLLTSKYPLHDTNGNINGLIGIGHDITKRKLSDNALKESYEFNNTLLKTIPFGMHIVSAEGVILFQSDGFRKIFGKNAIGSKCWELYRDDKKQCSDCPLFKGIKVGKNENYESSGVLGGKIFDISHTGILFQGKEAMLEIFIDISDRKKTEHELIKSKEKAEESDRLKTAFLHNISHEIRTPMNAIIGFSAMLNEPDLDKESQKSYVEIITQSSNHLLSIVSDIIEISNIEAGVLKLNIKTTNINYILLNLYNQYNSKALEKKIELSFAAGFEDVAAQLLTDEPKLTQVLSSLLSNAVKFTSSGKITIGYCLKENYIEFYVKDTGIGISQNQFKRIFDRFYQVENSISRQYEGTGLGLSIAKAYVELLGGRIWLTSEPGNGSTFFFTIPLVSVSQPDVSAAKVMVKESSKQAGTKAILIAEDEENNFRLMQTVLSHLDLNIMHAENGKEAVDMCRSDLKIDLIVMDIKMPVMDGYEATGIIKKIRPSVPIIAQTAFAFESDRINALNAGCDDYLSKPVKKDLFIEMIMKYL